MARNRDPGTLFTMSQSPMDAVDIPNHDRQPATLNDITKCPICKQTLVAPILQCRTGHSMCGKCIIGVKLCPECGQPTTNTRNLQLERMMAQLGAIQQQQQQQPHQSQLFHCCKYSGDGCKLHFTTVAELHTHEASDCRYRKVLCGGHMNAHWPCTWCGSFTALHKHFQSDHGEDGIYMYKMDYRLPVSFEQDVYDLKLIPFFNGHQLFWYKHRVDVAQRRLYWAFQLLGSVERAKRYYYEFEVAHPSDADVRKLKTTEYCQSDSIDANREIFQAERCVAISFEQCRHYLDEHQQIAIKFRIMHIKEAQ